MAVRAVSAVNKAETAGFIGRAFAIGFARFEVGAGQTQGIRLTFLHIDRRLQFNATVFGASRTVYGTAAVRACARVFDAVGNFVAGDVVDFVFVHAAFDAANALGKQVAIADA